MKSLAYSLKRFKSLLHWDSPPSTSLAFAVNPERINTLSNANLPATEKAAKSQSCRRKPITKTDGDSKQKNTHKLSPIRRLHHLVNANDSGCLGRFSFQNWAPAAAAAAGVSDEASTVNDGYSTDAVTV